MDSADLGFYEDLKAVEAQLRQELDFKAGNFDELVQLSLDELGQNVCPAIVLAVSKTCHYAGQQEVRLATVIQYIFMAGQVHRLVNDDRDIPEENRQFPVLVGDALYGNFFLGLCHGKMLSFLTPLAEVMCAMNEGAISRWMARERDLDNKELLAILEREMGSLTSRAARLSAELSGADGYLTHQCEEFGLCLGMAWAAYEEKMERGVVRDFVNQAAKIVGQLPANCDARPLQEVLEYVTVRILP